MLTLTIITASTNYFETNSRAMQYDAFVETLEKMREKGDSIENAAIQKDIATWNQYIASRQYYRKILPLFIPDVVEEWEMIE